MTVLFSSFAAWFVALGSSRRLVIGLIRLRQSSGVRQPASETLVPIGVERRLEAGLRRLGQDRVEVIIHEWQPWFQEWNRELLACYDPTEHNAFVDAQVTPAVLTSGWLGFPGVSEEQLAELELRLGVTVPPSYRSFLRVSNGFLQPGVNRASDSSGR